MKSLIYIIALLLVSQSGLAQDVVLKDNLVANKDNTLSKYLPMYNGEYLYKVYVMPMDEVENQLNSFQKALSSEISKQKTAELKELAKKDVDYHAKNAMAFILAQYGLDSLGVVARNKTMKEKNGNISADEMADVYLKAFVKKLSREERKSWTEKIYGNPDLRNEALYKASASYRTWLTNFIDHVDKSKYKSTSEGYVPASILKLRMVLEEIPVGFIRDELDYRYTTAVFNMVKDTVAKEKVYREFMARSKSTQHLEQLQNDYDNYKMMTSNAVSPDFSYGDVDGKMVTLSSLRGKYVYIDVWATWCVPCKAEIPSLQKVEHDYNAKNIVFVSLSVDYLKDEDTWRKYVKQNKLSGIQVRADKDFKSDFIKKYNINSIPRFILLNPEGKILSGDAYRPSDVKLRAQLDRLLD